MQDPNYLTYKTSLVLSHLDKILNVGVCFSTMSLEVLKASCNDFLHPQEHAYVATLLYPRRQYSYLLGRYCAKQAIDAYTPLSDLTKIWIDTGAFQQPVVVSPLYSNLQVSISHTDTLGAALAFSEGYPMAIDIETISPSRRETIQSQLTLNEKTHITDCLTHSFSASSSLSSEPEDLDLNLTLLWTAKEALSKVLKCGLTAPFEIFEIKEIMKHGTFVESYFKNFSQYKSVSFPLSAAICSIVYPKRMSLTLNVPSIQSVIRRSNP